MLRFIIINLHESNGYRVETILYCILFKINFCYLIFKLIIEFTFNQSIRLFLIVLKLFSNSINVMNFTPYKAGKYKRAFTEMLLPPSTFSHLLDFFQIILA